MNAIREGVFECTYSSSARLRTAHVRAWDAGEAVELFAHELRGDGVTESGTISVRAASDRRPRRSVYRLARGSRRGSEASPGARTTRSRLAPRAVR